MFARPALFAALCALALPGVAAERILSLCPPPQAPEMATQAAGVVEIHADRVEASENTRFQIEGDVAVEYAGRRLEANRAAFDSERGTISAPGAVRYQDSGLSVQGRDAELHRDAGRGEIEAARYRLFGRPGRGSADRIVVETDESIRLEGASYTTCEPGDDAWLLKAGRIELFRAENEGRARNVTVEVAHVPVFYLPYISFPLGQRKSGFLAPSYGSSDLSGTELRIPYYFNLAPNYDATLAPRALSRRGVQLQGEFRYLTPDHSGTMLGEYLPYDRRLDDERTRYSLRHRGVLSGPWQMRWDINGISERDYFRDLGTSLSESAQSFQERRFELDYRHDGTAMRVLAQDFQVLERIPVASRPYRRLPQLEFSTASALAEGPVLQLTGELTRFYREEALDAVRLDVQPAVMLDIHRPGGFFRPRVALRHTRYWLSGAESGAETTPDRTLPIASVDTGLYFERDTGQGDYVQLLEPRLFYLYVPYRNQTGLVRDASGVDTVFDSARPDFTFDTLWRGNRYTGADRVSDANQMALAVLWRLQERATGVERAHLGLGQIFYIDVPRVTLPGEPPDVHEQSDLLATAQAQLHRRWSMAADLQWDAADGEIEKGRLWSEYRQGEGRARLGYNYRADTIEQADLALAWPINRRWQAAARWNHSLLEDRVLEAMAGLQYRSCCWSLGVVMRRYLNDTFGNSSNSIQLQVELVGLGGVGSGTGIFAERGMLTQ